MLYKRICGGVAYAKYLPEVEMNYTMQNEPVQLELHSDLF